MVISIVDTGWGQHSAIEYIKTVLRKIEYWHQGSIAKFRECGIDGNGKGRGFLPAPEKNHQPL